MITKTKIWGLAGLLLACGLASASTSLNLGAPTSYSSNGGVANAEASYTFSIYSFSAYGYGCTASTSVCATPTALFAKALASPESGLGLANDASGEDEITLNNFVQLDLSLLHSDTVLLQVSSLTGTDAFQFYTSGTKGEAGNAVSGDSGNGTSNQTNGISTLSYSFVVPASGNYFVSLAETAANPANILLGPGSIQGSVPEPGSIVMLGSGLLFGATLLRRRTKRTSVLS